MLPRWPPLLWVVVYTASLLILMGGTQGNHTAELVAGLTLTLVAFAGALYLALRPGQGDARPPYIRWSLGGLAAFYVLVAIAGGIAGPAYAFAGLLAGVIPMTALALLLATIRSKTARADGRLRDTSADADEDPFPGIGVDEDTPLGDTPQHSDAVDRTGAPGRHAA